MTSAIRSPLIYAAQQQSGDSSQPLNFYDGARNVNWRSLLSYAEKTVDLIVYYCPAWVDAHREEIKAFLSRPGTKLRLIMSDPRNPLILREIRKMFSEFSEAEIFVNIRATQKKLNEILESIEGPKGALEFFLLPRLLNYPCHRFDNEVVVFSLFEMHRQRKLDAPAVVVNLLDSPQLRDFFEQEWDGLLREGIRCDFSKLIG